MSSKDDNYGLLSRVVNFVRNPALPWGSATEAPGDYDAQVSKQMLRELIERRRRNDFVRKREFDMLRKLRRSDVMAGQDHLSNPSFFHSSILTKTDDRASTLKKIDDIEAQMSMQWWKSNSAGASLLSGSGSAALSGTPAPQRPAPNRPAAESPSTDFSMTEPLPLRTDVDDSTVAGELVSLLAFGFDERGNGIAGGVADGRDSSSNSSMTSDQASLAPGFGATQQAAFEDGASFSPSKFVGLSVEEQYTHDPELEEAAILFANGDAEGAAAGLLEVLAPGGPRMDHDETWLTLLDLYRATGQQEHFEPAAIDYALRFGRSAPQWVSFPDAVGHMNLAPTAAGLARGVAIADWTSPAILGPQSVAAMNAALARSPRPWRLNWVKLATLEPAALEPLRRAFAQWSGEPQPVRFLAAEKLEKLLRDATPSGDDTVNPQWWKLRMEALRLTQQPDAFEMAALDYCVTYEVSPPSWEKSLCDYMPLQHDGTPVPAQAIVGDVSPDSVLSSHFDGGRPGSVSVVELAGEILGDATEAIAMLDEKLGNAETMVISCARLIRIDFSSAGMLLNWVTERSEEGRQLQFTQVHRLVAAFFGVVAIGQHARVAIRTD